MNSGVYPSETPSVLWCKIVHDISSFVGVKLLAITIFFIHRLATLSLGATVLDLNDLKDIYIYITISVALVFFCITDDTLIYTIRVIKQ